MAHGDYTGMTKADLAARHAQQQQFAAQSMSMVSAVVDEGRKNNVVDLFTEDDKAALEAQAQPVQTGDGVQQVRPKDNSLGPVKFMASETVEQITVGKDREFNLEAGQVYKAPRWVVHHLDEKMLVRH